MAEKRRSFVFYWLIFNKLRVFSCLLPPLSEICGMAIRFQSADVKFCVPQATLLKSFLEKELLKKRPKDYRLKLSFIFCSDEYLLGINRQFLNHDFYTDIITFPLRDTSDTLEAEIYISTERVKDNAQKFEPALLKASAVYGSPFHRELHRVIFHGVLHLLGYRDKSKAQQTQMRTAEDLWLKKYAAFLKKNIQVR